MDIKNKHAYQYKSISKHIPESETFYTFTTSWITENYFKKLSQEYAQFIAQKKGG